MEDRLIRAYVRWESVKQILRSEKGQGMVEYGLILALVAVVAAAAFTGMQGKLTLLLNDVAAKLHG